MKKFLVIHLFLCSIALAQQPDDTTKMYQVPEVRITSTRFVHDEKVSPLNVSIIERQAIRSLNASSIADVLQTMGGVTIKRYGGSSGIKTISQSGMGSEHTIILLNGMRISLTQNALLDLGLYGTELFDAVELVSDGSSSFHGADAVAGVVNLITKSAKEPFAFSANAGIGSFGLKRYSASIGASSNSAGIRIGAMREASDEDYPFTVSFGPTIVSSNRKNADFTSTSLYAMSDGYISEKLSYTLYSSWLSSERGVPGVFVSPLLSNNARQEDEDALFTGGIAYALAAHSTLNTQFLTRYFYERYNDPAVVVGGEPVDNYFKNIDLRILSHITISSGNTKGNIGGELANVTGHGNSLKQTVDRPTASAFASVEHTAPIQTDIIEKVIVLPSIRLDAISGFPVIVSPSFALSLVSPSISLEQVKNITVVLRGSVSRNFSAPTFNQLYYNGGGGVGNPNIRPEHGISSNAGGGVFFEYLGVHLFNAKYFFIRLNDRIVWLPAGTSGVSPKNVRRTSSEGVELRYNYTSKENIVGVTANYSLTSAKKIAEDFPGDPNVGKYLIYVPMETLSGQLHCNVPVNVSIISSIGLSGEFQRIGYRYTREDNSQVLPTVDLLNANLRAELTSAGITSTLKFEVNNITNQQYQIMYSYPMPGRSFRFTAGIQL